MSLLESVMGWIWSERCRSTSRMDGKIAIVTGSNSGIGKYTALDFVKRGAVVVLACRDQNKGEQAAQWIRKETEGLVGVGSCQFMHVNLASFNSVRSFASAFNQTYNQLNILVNNAGVMLCPRELSEDGYEMHLATNHLGHFLLTLLLLPTILNSTPARIVNVSSSAHASVNSISFDDVNYEKSYSPSTAFARSKLANVLFTKALANRLEGQGVTVNCVDPGQVKTEAWSKGQHSLVGRLLRTFSSVLMKGPELGAQTSIHCAVDESASQQTGQYYCDCRVASPSTSAQNMDLAEQLWMKSIELVGWQCESHLFNDKHTSDTPGQTTIAMP